eukprot:TRINITY_DN1923_c0_g1_i11.p1 TRINITY_DN1923_c0_g1~~TRINITY_DN1923_c0_g1_i11.p1  ORF type:complete len:356 (-),score=36.69 TRINITY_DN1923_c0_g1_i11:602-1621(-)
MSTALFKQGKVVRLSFHGSESVATDTTAGENTGVNLESVVQDYYRIQRENPQLAVAVVVIRALTNLIKCTETKTMMGMLQELKQAAEKLISCNLTDISCKAACEMFVLYTSRVSPKDVDIEDFEKFRSRLIQRGEQFTQLSTQARKTAAELGARFIHNGSIVLLHGFSRVVSTLLERAVCQGKTFRVIVTEGRPDGAGIDMARHLKEIGLQVTMILDTAVAYMMERVDLVLVGAEAVVESGGIINRLGTYQIAICAKAFNKPFYVASESYKFARLYPLNQSDLPLQRKRVDFEPLIPDNATIDNPSRDFTPPNYITLLFTDLGVLTPAAVSDELIQLYV